MDRETIIKKFIDATALKIAKVKFSIDDAQETANNAPGPMQSASDTTKSEMNLLISGLNKERERLNALLKAIYRLSEDHYLAEVVLSGTIVKIEKDQKEFTYFIMEDCGGIDIKTDAGTVSGLSTSSPVAEQLISKEKGASFMFNGQTIKIIKIF